MSHTHLTNPEISDPQNGSLQAVHCGLVWTCLFGLGRRAHTVLLCCSHSCGPVGRPFLLIEYCF
jgi:hypothetical protein